MIFGLLRNLKIGLIQLSRELKIADKNKAVDSILRLPRRGSDFLKLCADTRSSDKLKGSRRAARIAVNYKRSICGKNA